MILFALILAASPIADEDGHLSPAVFSFVKPGVELAQVEKALGEPFAKGPAVTPKGEVNLFVNEPILAPSKPGQKPRPVEQVLWLDYRTESSPLEFARVVVRDGKVWYAMLPPQTSERSVEKLKKRYGDRFVRTDVTRNDGHSVEVLRIWRLPQDGLAFVEAKEGITHRVVFPAEN